MKISDKKHGQNISISSFSRSAESLETSWFLATRVLEGSNMIPEIALETQRGSLMNFMLCLFTFS